MNDKKDFQANNFTSSHKKPVKGRLNYKIMKEIGSLWEVCSWYHYEFDYSSCILNLAAINKVNVW